jgi:CRP/FNR family transcriptional regulator
MTTPAATTKATMASFLERYSTRRMSKGEIIIFQGEEPRGAFIVKSGVVKAYNLSVNGDEKPVGFEAAGDVFPAPWTFRKAPSALYYYEAFSDVELYVVPRDEYVAFLKSHNDILAEVLEHYVSAQLGDSMRLNALQHSRASDKLIYTLHYLGVSHGRTTREPHVVEITLDLTHQDFANLTGLTRETTATELNRLKSRGVISYGKRIPYTIDLKKLNAMLNDQFIADMQLTL